MRMRPTKGFWLWCLGWCWGLVALMGCSQEGRVVEVTVASPGLAQNLLGDPGERLVWVYLPPHYDRAPDARFPVIYLLHGFGVEPRFWKDGGPRAGRLTWRRGSTLYSSRASCRRSLW